MPIIQVRFSCFSSLSNFTTGYSHYPNRMPASGPPINGIISTGRPPPGAVVFQAGDPRSECLTFCKFLLICHQSVVHSAINAMAPVKEQTGCLV